MIASPPPLAVIPATSTDPADLPHPDNGPYFIIDNEGAYLYKQTFFGRAIVPVRKIDPLPELAASKGMLYYDIPKLPATLLGQAWSFFADVYDKHKIEAMVYITHSAERGYRLFVPTQRNGPASVNSDFNLEHIAVDHALVGTIHSHCDFSAFHSGTDDTDAAKHDGLHITIGHVNTDTPSYAAMISVNGVDWNMKLEDVTDGTPPKTPHPAWWLRYVTKGSSPAATTQTYRPKPHTVRQITGPTTPQPNKPAAPTPSHSSLNLWTSSGHEDLMDAVAETAYDLPLPIDHLALAGQAEWLSQMIENACDQLSEIGVEARIRYFSRPDLADATVIEDLSQ